MSWDVFTSKHVGYIARSRVASWRRKSSGSSRAPSSVRAMIRGGTKPISVSYGARIAPSSASESARGGSDPR
jgi:hypothetical protein